MAATRQGQGLGDECTVVLMGKMFRCIMTRAEAKAERGVGMAMQALGDAVESWIPTGPMRHTLHVDYIVLEELALDAVQSQRVQQTLQEAAKVARDRSERQIDLDD